MKLNIIRRFEWLHKVNAIKDKLFSSKNLLYTNVAVSISLSAVGDMIEQHYEIIKGHWEKWSPSRTKNMAVSGMSVGIFCHFWYKHLDSKLAGRTSKIVLKKVIIDQLIGSPLCIGIFFLTTGLMERNNLSEFKNEIINKAHKLYIAEWIIWPPAQIINFSFLPTKYRVLYDNTISLGYDVYTSQVKYNKNDVTCQ